MSFVKLTDEQLDQKLQFIEEYMAAENAASGSDVDANANVEQKNMATMETEINKDINVQVNRRMIKKKITELFDEETAQTYQDYLDDHVIYTHDESSIKPYCASISMYPFLLNGLKDLGGDAKAPKNLNSFCGSFINLVFAVSAMFAGAIATVEFLMYFDYFARKEFGENYLDCEENRKVVERSLSQVVYSINQPAAARGYQAVFWNISIFDKNYFESMFDDFMFPDFTGPSWDSLDKLQKYFMNWFNNERELSLLTFPVVTAAILTDDGKVKDPDFHDFLSQELSEGNSFFMYLSDSADSLASCCRLRNEVVDNTFSYSLGAGGVSTGSTNVITINWNRLVQKDYAEDEVIRNVQKFQVAFRHVYESFRNARMLPTYDGGFIDMDKQFLTIGINGMVEAAEFLDIDPSNTNQYKDWVAGNLSNIHKLNKEAKKEYGFMFNTEFVPAENLGVKNAKWDKQDGLVVNRDCYNSYFYPVEDTELNVVDKFQMHGKEILEYLDGGSALHLNLAEYPTKEGYKKLLNLAASTGCNYFTTNVAVTCCESCGHINKHTTDHCVKCGSTNVTLATRVIGFLKKLKSYSAGRKIEAGDRHYHA